MGYCTDFELTIHEGFVDKEQFIDDLNEITTYTWYDDFSLCDAKWYHHNEDMKRISEKYKNVVFKLHGTGEEGGDIWEAYYKNGKMQFCPAMITFDQFNESKLK
jgi:hypothetical protein